MKKKDCDCICHKLGYVYCGPEYCPDHTASTNEPKPSDAN